MNRLRRAALIAAVGGAGVSLGLMLRVGQRNPSVLLLALFALWDLSPFAALVWANAVSQRWPPPAPALCQGATLVVTLGSLSAYGFVAFGPPRSTPAFAFLAVPLASWALLAITAAVSALISRKRAPPA